MDVPNSDKYGLQPWILKKLQLDTPDMLVNYILLLISNDKTIPEITTELGELLGEDEARAFTSSLEVEMKRKIAPAASSSSSSSSSGAKRLLQTAMQPVVSAKNGGESRGKRSLNDGADEHTAPREQKEEASADQPKRARGLGTQDQSLPMPSMQMPSMLNNPMGGVSSANVFLQQMNMMAQAAGYRDADAMMVGIHPQSPLFLHPYLYHMLADPPHSQ